MIGARSIAALLAAVQPAASVASHRVPDVYLLMGQSNMSGRGAMEDLDPAERVPDPRILLYGNDGQWKRAIDPVDSAVGQIDGVSADPDAAVGPALPFARKMLTLRGRPIALVPCSKGGSSILQWKPSPGRDTLYGSCLARTQEAGGRVAGVLWYQGETDGSKAAAAALWAGLFTDMAAALRRDLGAPALPIVLVELAERPGGASDPRYPEWEMVRRAQRSLVGPCTVLAPAEGLPLAADKLHLTTRGERTLGIRLALAMRRVQKRCSGRP